jgi:hypothetical protein
LVSILHNDYLIGFLLFNVFLNFIPLKMPTFGHLAYAKQGLFYNLIVAIVISNI